MDKHFWNLGHRAKVVRIVYAKETAAKHYHWTTIVVSFPALFFLLNYDNLFSLRLEIIDARSRSLSCDPLGQRLGSRALALAGSNLTIRDSRTSGRSA